MSDWGWHKFENTDGLTPADSWKSVDLGHGHPEVYAVEYKASKGDPARNVAATEYFRVNPHRLNLGVIGLAFTSAPTTEGSTPISRVGGGIATAASLPLSSLTDIHQELKLYDGLIESSFAVGGSPVEVTTAAVQDRDAVIYRIKSPLLKDGRARVAIRFPYPTGKHADDAADWTKPERHTSTVVGALAADAHSALIEHRLDSTVYYLQLRWQGDATLTEVAPHHFQLSTTDDVLAFEAEYSPNSPTPSPSLGGEGSR
jgi:hypothetical protein